MSPLLVSTADPPCVEMSPMTTEASPNSDPSTGLGGFRKELLQHESHELTMATSSIKDPIRVARFFLLRAFDSKRAVSTRLQVRCTGGGLVDPEIVDQLLK